MRFSIVSRWRRLSAEKRRAIVEAATLLALSSAAVRFSRFRSAMRLAAWPLASPPKNNEDREIAVVAWAVSVAARRARYRAVCIEQGLAAQIMLRRRGVPSKLHYGLRKFPQGPLDAHVWVTARDRPVTGCENAEEFELLASFPADSPDD